MSKQHDPRMHTAEHILNQTMDRLFDTGRSFRAHIEKKKSKCDYKFTRMLSDEELRHVEEQVNGIIQSDLPVLEKKIGREEASRAYSMGKVPKDAGDTIRIVSVGDYDSVPCIGEHVAKTSDIGRFYITSADFEDGVLRLRFKLDDTDEKEKGGGDE
jgi:alanyl-tRNA synthetase